MIQAESGIPLQATVYANDTPVATITDETGGYTISLPEGTYELVASSEGHRLGKAMVAVSSGLTLLHDFVLREGPESLLVDSGQWYYRSQIGFFETALTENNYRHDLISIRDPFQDVPSAETLSEYDAVVWSSPTDSPAHIGAGEVISTYLAQGGKLFISGQNVGTFEELLLGSHSWWSEQLDAIHQGDVEPPFSITGLEGSIFSTMAITLNGASSAGNQEATNHVGIRSGSFTEAALEYDDGSLAGLQAGVCEPFNIVYLGFGLEGVSGAENRSEMISRAFDYFALPDRDIGIGFRPEFLNDIAVPGYRLTKTIDVINLSELVTDTVHLEVSGNNWPVSIITNTLTLGSCQAGRTTFLVDVPSGASRDTVEEFSIVATSVYSPDYSETFPVHLKTPGAILLVDDDRWYDQELTYRSALDAGGFDYDFWEIGSSPIVRGSPPSQTLNAYDIVIWYTGYDWFAPITDVEQESLASFLDHGGRLFLTSQDYLDMHPEDPFSSH